MALSHNPLIQKVEIPLTFDSEFFAILQGDVSSLDALQAGEQKALSDEIIALSREVTTLTKPTKLSKSDLYQWRELFAIYIEAGIFFSIQERDCGSRDSTAAVKQLQWFQSEATKRGLANSFKLPASRKALDRFIKINVSLLRNLKFQEINQRAIFKILKSMSASTASLIAIIALLTRTRIR